MYRYFLLAGVILFAVIGVLFLVQESEVTSSQEEKSSANLAATAVIAEDLTIPWDIAFLPDGNLLVTQRGGTLLLLDEEQRTTIPIQGVEHRGEGGLLGLALHPEFESNGYLYLYLTSQTSSGDTQNRIERYRLSGTTLSDRVVIFEGIPGAAYHDGGRIEFGPDGMLYVTTGDAGNEAAAQNRASLAGKILRLTPEGAIPADNPFGNAVYSYGHRNPQGIAWDEQGVLWSTEHGRSGALSGFDEFNRIEKGFNYGWPTIQGDERQADMQAPVVHSGARETWAPASLAYHEGVFYFGGLRGESLYSVSFENNEPQLMRHFQGQFGRIRTVRVGPDGMLYLTTSNADGRGGTSSGGDKVIRIGPAAL